MNKIQVINTLRGNEELLKDNFNILKIGLFGSCSTKSYSEKSDIDIIYEIAEGKRIGL